MEHGSPRVINEKKYNRQKEKQQITRGKEDFNPDKSGQRSSQRDLHEAKVRRVYPVR